MIMAISNTCLGVEDHGSWLLLIGCRSELSAGTARCESVLSHGFRRQDDSGRHNSSLAGPFSTD